MQTSAEMLSHVNGQHFRKEYSSELCDFFRRALALEPGERLSVEEALQHGWFTQPCSR